MAIDTTAPRTRRALLAGLAGGLVSAVAATLGRAQPTTAHDADDVRLGAGNSATHLTSITNTTLNGHGLVGHGTGAGSGIRGSSDSGHGVFGTTSTGTGVHGSSTDGIGMWGDSYFSIGVRGTSGAGNAVEGNSANGYGVFGGSSSEPGVGGHSDASYGVQGSSSQSIGVFGISASDSAVYGSSASPTLPAVMGRSEGDNTGLQGWSGSSNGSPPASPANTGVYGYASQDGTAVGVRGTSPAGRGGVFKGGVAQLKLVAASNATHPVTGQVGDLFVDRNHRLWFCKGGATWKQLA
jgi:hypothetical protein